MRRFVFVLIAGLAGCSQGDFGLGGGGPQTAAVEQSTLAAARTAEATGDYPSASGSWSNLLARHPQDPELALNLARSLRYGGQPQTAIGVLTDFTDKQGKTAPLLTELGKDYLAADRLGPAVRTLREAADLAPLDWQTLSALGVTLDYQGNYAEAQTVYGKALALAPDNPVLLNNLGLSQAQAGQLKDARATLEKAADQPRASAQVRQNLALVKALSGDLAGAQRLNRQDLTPEQMRANDAYYRLLSGAKIN